MVVCELNLESDVEGCAGHEIITCVYGVGLVQAMCVEQVLLLSHRLECSGLLSAHCSLYFLSSSDSPASAFRVAKITGTHHNALLIFVFLVKTRFHHVGQAAHKLLTPRDPPISASQSAGITGVSYCAQPWALIFEAATLLNVWLINSFSLFDVFHCGLDATHHCPTSGNISRHATFHIELQNDGEMRANRKAVLSGKEKV
ncbi:hypothetical protein AAY473_015770 [Plecturocebus cupreus]